MAGQGTPATVLLARQRVAHTLHPYDVAVDTPDYGAAASARSASAGDSPP
ncbi:MAG TPA: hypothetical protein VK020_03175 [Microlunatus sp.]|nr:hypothetical protein [Microlunatus sp.]